MQGTREQVLELVVRGGEVRVEDLAEALHITTAAVRRHLDHLRADGLVDVKAVRQATGRPFYAYFATAKAIEPLPAGYADLLERVLLSVEGRDEVTTAVAERMAETLASRHRHDVTAPEGDAGERIVQVTESLRHEGILDRWRVEDDGFRLVNGSCPYRVAAEVSRLPCESDRKTIELLLGRDVEQVQRIVDGAPACEYLVHVGPEAGETNQARQG